jgi:hypothetical protein
MAPPPPAEPKKKRRGWVVALVVIGILVLLSCCCAGSVFGWLAYRQNQARETLKSSVLVMSHVEAALKPVDGFVKSGFADPGAEALAGAVDGVRSAQKEAAAMKPRLTDAIGTLSGNEKAAGQKWAALLDVEIGALDQAAGILSVMGKAQPAFAPAARGWRAIQAERDFVKKSNHEWNKHTKAGVRLSDSYLSKAMASCIAAQTAYAQAKTAFPDGDFATYISYAKQRLPNLELSLKINSLWLGGNLSGANALIDKYNTQSSSLTKLLNAMDAPQATRPVTDGIGRALGTGLDDYKKSRAQAMGLADTIQNLTKV